MSRHIRVQEAIRAALGLALLSTSAGAFAQAKPAGATDEPLENVVITGSRIIRDGFESPTPVSVLGAERLEERAASNIGDALNELPAFRGTQTPAAQGFSGGYVGGRVLDLRGLGTQRTLTLVDGKRFVPSTTQGTVDTNMIPTQLIERVDVVTGGASAAYGSDAVAGVVNFIVNEKMTGLKAAAEYGESAQHDDRTIAYHFSGGTNAFGGRGHVIFAADFEENSGIGTCIVRDWCRDEVLNFGRPPATATPNQPQISVVPRVNGVFPLPANNILAGIRPSTIAPGGVINTTALAGITFTPDGTPRAFQYGSLVNSLFMVGGEGRDRNGYFEGIPIKAATRREAFYTRTRFDITDDITARFDLSFGHLRGTHYAGQYRNTLSTTAITVKRDNAFLPRSTNPLFDIPTRMDALAITQFQLGRHYWEFGNPKIESNDGALRGVLALDGSIAGSWKWDAYYQYGRNQFNTQTSNNVINANMAKAFDAVRTPAGAAVCRVNADVITTNDDPTCVALNPFGNLIDPLAWKYVTGTSVQHNTMTEHVAAANAHGDLFSTWAGPVGGAVGLEYRSDDLQGSADAISNALGFFGNNAQNINGKIKVKEGYAETIVPLAKDLFLARDLQLNGAVRRTQYERSSSGSSSSVDATTWKVGGTWTPLDWVRLRATKSRDIRAPNVAELYGPTTAGFAILNDPARGGAQTNPATLSGANPNLNPEVADTETYGIVFQPQLEGALGRVQLSVDYFEILMSGAIGTLGSQTIVTRCFQGAAEFCSLITRDAANGNVITLVKDVALNVNKQITRGVDVEVGYKQPLGAAGDLDLRLLANFVADLKTIDTAGVTERAGQTGMRGGVNPGMPDYTLDAMVTWKRGPAQATLHGRYIPDGLYNPLFVGPENPTFSNNLGNSTNTNAVPSALYLDLSGQYAVASFGNGSLTVYGAINNLTDKDAPRIPGTNGSGNNVLFDVTGRAYKLGMRYKF